MVEVVPCRAVVADPFYGEDDGFRQCLERSGGGLRSRVVALALVVAQGGDDRRAVGGRLGSRLAGCLALRRGGGRWCAPFATGTRNSGGLWKCKAGPYGPQRAQRALVVSTDPVDTAQSLAPGT